MKLNENIKILRKQKNLKQEQLAEAMGVSATSVSKWENGQCAPELTVLMELADFFEVSMDTLVGHKLNPNRLEYLIGEMEKRVDSREEEIAESLCEKILRNYPNDTHAVESCANGYYRLYIYTNKKSYMEECITQTKRLMKLKEGEPEREKLERLHYLGNQYSNLEEWDTAIQYYEQSEVAGNNRVAIAECLLQKGEAQKGTVMLSDALLEKIFQLYHTTNVLADAWIAVNERQKAVAVLNWIYEVMESLDCNPTAMLLIQVKLAGIFQECDQLETAKAAIRKAAELLKKESKQEFGAGVEFLQSEKTRELLISGSGNNRELFMGIIEKMGEPFTDIAKEVLE